MFRNIHKLFLVHQDIIKISEPLKVILVDGLGCNKSDCQDKQKYPQSPQDDGDQQAQGVHRVGMWLQIEWYLLLLLLLS